MIRFLKALILLPVAVAAVLLAVANRAPVTLSFDPFSQDSPEFSVTLPLYAVILGAIMVGVLIGGVAAWIAQAKHRRGERIARRDARHLRQEADRLRAQQAVAPGPALPAPRAS